ncbi:MAG: cytochrome P450 [Pseudomonadota bacterium]
MDIQLASFPIGATVELDALSANPYPILKQLQQEEPVSYVPALNLYFVTRYADVVTVLKDTDRFVVGTEHSLILDIFGEHMMTVEGAAHDHHKKPHRPFFLPNAIRRTLDPTINRCADALIDEFVAEQQVELRSSFSSRLPIQIMLSLFGIPLTEERHFRLLYDDLELAVSNFTWDPTIRNRGKEAAKKFHEIMQHYLDRVTSKELVDEAGLLASLKNTMVDLRLTDAEIRHNAIIIFFGGISTVDALILNTLYALSTHTSDWQAVVQTREFLPKAIDETIRWLGPVQSATRHVIKPTSIHGVDLHIGDTVNCMLAAANRDPEHFEEPEKYNFHRINAHRHLGFATGVHHCLGSNLARLEAQIAIDKLMRRLPGLRINLETTPPPTGYEFRQPRAMYADWA